MHSTVVPENTVSLAVMAELGFEHARDEPNDDGSVTRVPPLRKPVE